MGRTCQRIEVRKEKNRKWKCYCFPFPDKLDSSSCLVTKLCPTPCKPTDCQAILSMGFPRQEYWSGLPFPSSGDLPDPGIKHTFPLWQADSLLLSHWGNLIKLDRQLINQEGGGLEEGFVFKPIMEVIMLERKRSIRALVFQKGVIKLFTEH